MDRKTPPFPQLRRALRVVGWNALGLFAGLILLAAAGEAYFRLAKPFMKTSLPPREFVPNVGMLWKPGAEMRYTNRSDYWVVSRANSLGFFDREPPSPEPAAAGCRIAVIGDSFVEAKEVPAARKLHVRLERLAAAALPRLEIAAAAFGLGDTGQIQQLPFWDEYARRLRPKLLVLVFVPNDFSDNSPILRALLAGRDPQYPPPEAHAARLANGEMELRPPAPPNEESRLPRIPGEPEPWAARALRRASGALWFASRLEVELLRWDRDPQLAAWAALLSQRPCCAALFAEWRPPVLLQDFGETDPPPVYMDALDYTAFALEQFQQRADRSGAALVILASHRTKVFAPGIFERMNALAAALDIPVIDHADYILRQGAALRDAEWRNDTHWNADGHRWAAEALLEWLQENREVCADAQSARRPVTRAP